MTLSDRIAALSAPDRAMDAEIAKALCLRHGPFDGVCMETRSTWHVDELASHFTRSIDAALTLASPALQAHVTCNALDLFGTMGYSGGKFTEALAIAICVVALREKGL